MRHVRSFSVPRRHLVAVIVSSLLASASGVAALGQRDAERVETISVDNGLLRIAIEPGSGRVVELRDVGAKHNHLGDAKEIHELWEVEIIKEGEFNVLRPAMAESSSWERLPDPEIGLRMRWSHFTLLGTSNCKVEATVRLEADDSVSRWSITIDKPSGTGIRTIRFPRVSGLARQTDERLALPIWMGQRMSKPRPYLRGTNGQGRRIALDYPGRLSMQCLAYYRDGGCGFYAACNDTTGMRKTFSIAGTADEDVHYEMLHYPVADEKETERYVLPYEAILGSFYGDWITAAERYRAWAIRQRWARDSRLNRGRVPDWVLKTGLWVWNRGRSPGVLPPAAAMQERLGLPVSVFWHWWHGCPYDIGFPEYLPPREGTAAFEKAVRRSHENGLRMIVYMNQRAWGMSTKSWEQEGAKRFAVKNSNGKVQPEVYNIFTQEALASMCLATPFWRNKYAGLAEEAHNELGVDGIYMDQACSQKPCYDPSHPHPLGGGNSWLDGFRILSEDIRQRSTSGRPIVLAGEGCGEVWLPWLDLMLALQVSRERYASTTDPWEPIPFFQAVYHPYAITYGNYSSLVMPPYDELWPAEFAPAEPLALLDRKYSRQYYLEQARTFVWGQQLTLANFRESLFEERPLEIEYLMRLARLRDRGAKYLLHGTFLRPPELNVPWVTSEFSRLSIYAGQNGRLTTSRRRHPLALAGAWRADDGDVAVAVASIADETLTMSFTLDADAYGLPEKPRLFRLDTNGRHPISILDEDPIRITLTLPARGACLIEFCKNVF